MKYFFIGAFSDFNKSSFLGSSAGAKVQIEIKNTLRETLGDGSDFIMAELPSWPRGKVFVSSERSSKTSFLSFLNISVFKRPTFFLHLFHHFIKHRPKITIQYNSSLSGVFFSFVTRMLSSKSVLILQDLHASERFSFRLFLKPRQLIEFIYSRLLPYCFDLYIPITRSYIEYFNLPLNRCHVFPGGVLETNVRSARSACSGRVQDVAKYGVFAGALEKYNGVDLLICHWPSPEDLNLKLHIFGRGRLVEEVLAASEKNPNIVYHGFKHPNLVLDYIEKASVNFCLRYSKGLRQEYFFPSKLFDLLLCRGRIICNDFENFPVDLKGYVQLVSDDLEGLTSVLESCSRENLMSHLKKIEYLEKNYSWSGFLSDLISRHKF